MNPLRRSLHRLRSVTVGRQLDAAFAVTLIVSGAVSAVGVTSMRRFEQATTALEAKWLAGVGTLAQIKGALLSTAPG